MCPVNTIRDRSFQHAQNGRMVPVFSLFSPAYPFLWRLKLRKDGWCFTLRPRPGGVSGVSFLTSLLRSATRNGLPSVSRFSLNAVELEEVG